MDSISIRGAKVHNLKNIDVNDLFNKLKSGGFGDKKLLIKNINSNENIYITTFY